MLASHVLVPPAIEAVLNDPLSHIHGILGAGHVCAIMGMEEYYPLVDQYKVPIVITGFEPVDLLEGILMTVKQLEAGEAKLENQYARIVKTEGNLKAREIISEVFEVADRQWRGIGVIPRSGYSLKEKYALYDAERNSSLTYQQSRKIRNA